MEEKKETKFDKFCDVLIRISCAVVFTLLIFLILGTFLDLKFIPRTSGLYNHNFIITCLVLVFVFVLSKKYESISVFKIFELKKSLNESKNLNINLERKNEKLLEHIVSISNTSIQSQSQGVINVNGANIEDLRNLFKIEPASEQEKKEHENEEDKAIQEIEERRKQRRSEYEYRKQTEALVIDAILKDKFNAMKDVKFVSFSDKIVDPIAKDIRAIFDGYYKTQEEEVFVDVIQGSMFSTMRMDRLYHVLNKIYLYRKMSNSNIYLRLVLLNMNNENNRIYVNKRQLEHFFEPAIQNGLLTVEIFGDQENFIQEKLTFDNKE